LRHANTRLLFDYWTARRSGRVAPARADIAPDELEALMPRLFILRRMDRDHHVFRLAGETMRALHQRDLKDHNFLSLWRGHDRAHMSALIEGALGACAPATALAEARSMNGRSLPVEMAFLPLTGPECYVDRCLGLYQPLAAGGLGGRPAVRHVLREVRPAAVGEPAFEPAAHADAFAANDL
jgi:hypothetical protein